MRARWRKLINDLRDSFWLLPALMVAGGVLLGIALVALERAKLVPEWLVDDGWLYSGGGNGARALLGAVASSTIAVAGTVFSITIAALSLAAAQMGPRLLHNFTRDRGNQFTLGVFLGTFSYALVVLRSVRSIDEGAFIPHLSLSVGIALAFLCVATLVYFVGHMASRINVETVVELVAGDLQGAVRRLAVDKAPPKLPPATLWSGATPLVEERYGYLQEMDSEGLADWAAEHDTAIRLMVGPGDYVFPGVPIGLITLPQQGDTQALRNAMALGSKRGGTQDLELAFRKLVEVAVRALSPGINDPNTAIGALDRLGAALCALAPLELPNGVVLRDGRCVLQYRGLSYDRLLDGVFPMLRQNAASQVAVLIRMLDIMTAVASCERREERLAALQHHADLVLADGERLIGTPADLADLRQRHTRFTAARRQALPWSA